MGIILPQYLIGVDGGGTGCRAAIARFDGAVVATAAGGPANFATNPDQAIENVMSAISRAASDAALTVEHLQDCAAHVGLAGVLRDEDGAQLAASLPFARIRVSDDRLTSFAGAFGQGDGVLAAIGTGTLVASRHCGVHRYFGGWGLRLSDQASGAWLGRSVLEQCLLAHDGLAVRTDLTQDVLADFSNAPEALVAFARNAEPKDYAAFAPRVVQAAAAQDETGYALMACGAKYLNSCFALVTEAHSAPICLSGGLGVHYAAYIEDRFRARLVAPAGSALDGALSLARLEYQKMEASR